MDPLCGNRCLGGYYFNYTIIKALQLKSENLPDTNISEIYKE